jgi:hypothetical protein
VLLFGGAAGSAVARKMTSLRCALLGGLAARLALRAPPARALSCAAQQQQQQQQAPQRRAEERPGAAAAATTQLAELPAALSAADAAALRAVIECAVGPLDFDLMNRNARKPRRANHGAKPCSSVARRAKRTRMRR